MIYMYIRLKTNIFTQYYVHPAKSDTYVMLCLQIYQGPVIDRLHVLVY